jgi:hypothetical protein
VLQDEFRIACTPRVRRGIDIDAGCGQLTTKVEMKMNKAAVKAQEDVGKLEQIAWFSVGQVPQVGVYEDEDDDEDDNKEEFDEEEDRWNDSYAVDPDAVDLESDDGYDDPEYSTDLEKQEAARLIALVQQGVVGAATPMMMTKMDTVSNEPTKVKVNLKSTKKKTRRKENDDITEMHPL